MENATKIISNLNTPLESSDDKIISMLTDTLRQTKNDSKEAKLKLKNLEKINEDLNLKIINYENKERTSINHLTELVDIIQMENIHSKKIENSSKFLLSYIQGSTNNMNSESRLFHSHEEVSGILDWNQNLEESELVDVQMLGNLECLEFGMENSPRKPSLPSKQITPSDLKYQLKSIKQMVRDALDVIEEKEDEKKYEEMIIKRQQSNNSIGGYNNAVGVGGASNKSGSYKTKKNKGVTSLGGSFVNAVVKKQKEDGSPEKTHHRVASSS